MSFLTVQGDSKTSNNHKTDPSGFAKRFARAETIHQLILTLPQPADDESPQLKIAGGEAGVRLYNDRTPVTSYFIARKKLHLLKY